MTIFLKIISRGSRGKPLHEGMGSFSLAIVRKYRSSNTSYYMAHIIHVTHSFQCFKYVITCNVKCSKRLLNFSALSVKTVWTFGHKSPFHSLIFFFCILSINHLTCHKSACYYIPLSSCWMISWNCFDWHCMVIILEKKSMGPIITIFPSMYSLACGSILITFSIAAS